MSHDSIVSDKARFHQKRYYRTMDALFISCAVSLAMFIVIWLTEGRFDPGVFVFLPVAAVFLFGIMSLIFEAKATRDRVLVGDYFTLRLDKILGRSK